ncbi:MAG: ABC transporter permease [Planctomycetaceae bacterium]
MLRFAIRNLWSRPLRSLLALLGLTVAIVGMVGLFSVAEGLDQMVDTTFGRIPGLVAMQPGAPIPLFSRLPASWGSEIANVPGVRIVNPEIWQRANLIDGKTIISPPRFLFGTDIDSRLKLEGGVYRNDLVAGRFLVPEDRGTNHAVVSRQIAEEFGKTLGDTLRVNGNDVEIVGIYHCGSLLLDVAIILDIGTVRDVTRFGADSVCSFYLEQTGEVDDKEMVERIQERFRGRELDPWQPSSALSSSGNPLADFLGLIGTLFNPASLLAQPKPAAAPQAVNSPNASAEAESLPLEVRSAADWAEKFDDFSADLDILLFILSGIGVTIAVLSIINTMLMSVSERIVEFGILKANGWSSFDVMKLITFESACLGIGGGVLGALIGWGATEAMNGIWPTRVHLSASPGLLLFAFLFSTVLGVLGGLYPAVWAMRMMPMDAIRR